MVPLNPERQVYRAQEGFVNLDCARRSQIDLNEAAETRETQFRSAEQVSDSEQARRDHSRIGKGDEEGRFGKVAASLNSQNLTERDIALFEEKIETVQSRTGLRPFQKRLFIKWFRAANQDREQFAEHLSAYMQRLGSLKINYITLDAGLLQYNKRQINKIYYLSVRSFDEVFDQRRRCFQWVDLLYDAKLISAGAALRIQALLFRAIPYMILDCAERNSFEELASSNSSDCSDGILFNWLEHSIRKLSRKVNLPLIPLAKQEIDFLLQVSWVIAKMKLLHQREMCVDFLRNLFVYLQSRSFDTQIILKKLEIYRYWNLRIYDEILGKRHLFAHALDGLQDGGYIEVDALNAILSLFEKSKSWDRFGKRDRFIRGLDKIRANGISFDYQLILQIFLVTNF